MITQSTTDLLTRTTTASEDGQRYFELSKPFLSLASPRAPGQDASYERATLETETGSREKSVQPGTSPEPAPARAVLEDISSRDEARRESRNEGVLAGSPTSKERC